MKSQDQIEDSKESPERSQDQSGFSLFLNKFAISNDKNIINNYEEGCTNFIVNICMWRLCGS